VGRMLTSYSGGCSSAGVVCCLVLSELLAYIAGVLRMRAGGDWPVCDILWFVIVCVGNFQLHRPYSLELHRHSANLVCAKVV